VKLGARAKRVGLFAALVLTLVAVRWVDGEPGVEVTSAGAATRPEPAAEPSVPTGRPPRSPAAGSQEPVADATGLDLSRLRRTPVAKPEDAFGARSWDPPPRKLSPREAKAQQAAAAAAVPPPQAPPLPYVYLGMLDGDDGRTVFLEQQDRTVAAHKGDVLDGGWRLDDANDTRIVFTYMPLDRQQFLTIGSP